LLLDVPHRHVVPTVPKTLRIFFKFRGPLNPSHIPDKGQVIVRYCGPYDHAPRGKVRKADRVHFLLGMVEEEPRPVPSKPRSRLPFISSSRSH
jgi:hypothetical protein